MTIDPGCTYPLMVESIGKLYPIGRPGLIASLLHSVDSMLHYRALRDISFTSRRGEFLGVLGKNGAGKSTLLRILGDVLPMDEGRLTVGSKPFGLFELGGGAKPSMTGRQYVRWMYDFIQVPLNVIDAKVDEVHAFSELKEYFDQPIRSYSTGMSARLYFATLISLNAPILLVDEALSVGDEHFQRKCWTQLRKLIQSGASGVLVSHDWESIVRLCRRTIVIDEGRIVIDDDSAKAAKKYLGGTEEYRESHRAHFGLGCPRLFRGEPYGEVLWEVPVSVREDGLCVMFSYGIEFIRPGWGRNILIIESDFLVASEGGEYVIMLGFDCLPIAAGEYEISLFLHSVDEGGARRFLDARGWLYEESVRLVVSDGLQAESVTAQPIVCEICSAS